ncbi:hypothetical protein CYMTET_24132 [Cymbomonas tetramitiformis]|uniref:Uncharacterized protein n=1 Tax=Cymbomonas tetramitiformis TaxID=36881 RepID=A0AAE0FWG9_9CHLO|nr:hypothetical protein CYMTET_24132 [Cymbomonas tetramitiformis]
MGCGAVRDRYPLIPSDLLDVTLKVLTLLVTTVYTNWAAPQGAQQGEVAGTAAAATIPTGEDSEAKQLVKIVIDKIRVLEHYRKNQKVGAPALKAAAAPHGGLNGYRPGMEKGAGKPVAFDPQEQRAVPRCYRSTTRWRRHESDADNMHALALCQVYQQAVGDWRDGWCAETGGAGWPARRAGGIREWLTTMADTVGLSFTTALIAGGEAGELSVTCDAMQSGNDSSGRCSPTWTVGETYIPY